MYSYSLAPVAQNPVAGGYTTSQGQSYTSVPSYTMSQQTSYTSASGGQLSSPAGLQYPGLIQAPSAAVAAAGPFQFYATPIQETIAEGSPMASSYAQSPTASIAAQSPTGSIAVGTPFNSAGVPSGFGVPETVTSEDPLAVPTAAALGPSPAGSMNPVLFESATSYESSLPGTTENMVPATVQSGLSLPTETELSGSYPGYTPGQPGSPVTAPGTQEVLEADAPLPAYGQPSPKGFSSDLFGSNAFGGHKAHDHGHENRHHDHVAHGASPPMADAHHIPATAPAGLAPPKVQPIALYPGMNCQIKGLDSLPGAPNLNGALVTLVSLDHAKDKWVVQQQDGKKARVPSAALVPAPRKS